MGISFEAKQVNPAAAILPISEFLVYYHQVGREHRDAGFEPPLKVFSFQQLFASECRLLDFFKRRVSNAKYGHCAGWYTQCHWSVEITRDFQRHSGVSATPSWRDYESGLEMAQNSEAHPWQRLRSASASLEGRRRVGESPRPVYLCRVILPLMNAKTITPILNVSDISASFAWFGKGGWRKCWDWGTPPTFGAVGSGECEIFLCQGGQGSRGKGAHASTFGPDGDETADKGVWMSVWVGDVDEVHRECVGAGLDVTFPPTDMPWRVREMHVRHPDGHVFRVSKGIGDVE